MRSAQRILDAHWDGKVPVDVRAIAEAMGCQVVGVPSANYSGEVELSEAGRPVIRYNLNESPTRQRFTIAHEIGHIVHGDVRPGKPKHQDGPNSFSTDAGYSEMKANQFAAALLMPAEVVRFAVAHGGKASVKQLTDAFGVSSSAMTYRLKNLKIV